MSHDSLRISVLSGVFAVCRLEPDAAMPGWATAGAFWSVTRTADELSIVCAEDRVPAGVRCEPGWRCLRVEGPLDFALTGVMAGLSGALARAGVSLFAVSTFDTDYLLVKRVDLDRAIAALTAEGHQIAS